MVDNAGDFSYQYYEAESGFLVAPMASASHAGAFGGEYILTDTSNSGTASVSFNVPSTGVYIMWGRVLSPTFTTDSFHVSVDGGEEDIWATAEQIWDPDWQWTRVTGRSDNGGTDSIGNVNAREFILASGSHGVTFRGRETDTKLDRILVTNDLDFVPTAVPNDTAPPTPGNSGTIATNNIAPTGLALSWTKATDDVSVQANLQYQVYQSLTNNIGSVASASANGTIIQAYSTDIATFNVTGLTASTSYYFNVVVKDESDKEAAYTMVNVTTLSALYFDATGGDDGNPCTEASPCQNLSRLNDFTPFGAGTRIFLKRGGVWRESLDWTAGFGSGENDNSIRIDGGAFGNLASASAKMNGADIITGWTAPVGDSFDFHETFENGSPCGLAETWEDTPQTITESTDIEGACLLVSNGQADHITSAGDLGEIYLQFKYKAAATPGSNQPLFRFGNTTTRALLSHNTDNKLQLSNSGGTTSVRDATLTEGVVYTIDLHILKGTGSNAVAEFRVLGDESWTGSSNGTWTTNLTLWRLGANSFTTDDYAICSLGVVGDGACDGSTEYTKSFTTEPTAVWDNDVLLTRGSFGSLATGQWDWSSNVLYLRLDGDADPDVGHTIEARVRSFGFQIDWATTPNVEFVDVDMEKFADTASPSVSITSPLDQATASGSIDIFATATDDTALSGVQFKIVGQRIVDEDTTIVSDTASVSWDTTTVDNGAYTLVATALDTTGNVASHSIQLTVDNGDIVSPTPGSSGNITTASVAPTSLTLNWTKATDDVSAQATLEYQVYQSLSANIDTVANAEANGTIIQAYAADIATFDVTGLSSSTEYFFNVIVRDEAGNKAAYTMKSQTTAAADAFPPIPGGSGTITTTSIDVTSLTLNWAKATDNVSGQAALEYQAYQSTSADIDLVESAEANGTIIQAYTPDIATFDVTGLDPDTQYHFNVLVRDEAGNKQAYTMVSDTTAPYSISNSGAANIASNSATVSWTTNEAGSSKVLFGLVASLGFETIETDTSPRVTDHSVILSNLIACSRYHYSTFSEDAGGNTAAEDPVGVETFDTTGCAGDSEILDEAAEQISVASPGAFSLGGVLNIATPANFTATVSQAYLQAKRVDRSQVLTALGAPSGKLLAQFHVYDFAMFASPSLALTSFDEPLTVTTTYVDSDITGLDPDTLGIFRHTGVDWVELDGCSHDSGNKQVSCTTTQFSVFGMGGEEEEGPPIPGNSGTITTASVGTTSLTLNWTKATDDVSAQGALQYQVYQSLSNNIDTVANAEANGTIIQAYTADISTFDVSGLSSSTTYFFNVIVQDEAGNKAAYTTKSQTTDSPPSSGGGGGGGSFTPVSSPTPTPTPTPTESEEETSFPQIKASYRPADFSLNEGDTVSAAGSDDPDVYIVNEHGYKRLFLNPIIFSFYGHLGGFGNVKGVSGDVRNAFPTSGLFRNCEADAEEVYAVEVSGEDTGTLHHVNMSGDQAVAEDAEFFKKVFCINNNEFSWYTDNGQTFGAPYTSLAQVPVYARTSSEGETEQETEEETAQEPEAEPESLLSTLVKTASDPTVYYINSKGIKKPIPTLELFLAYGNSFANVKTVSQAQLDGFPLFQAITLVGGDGTVYTVDMANRTRHWVRDLTVFEELGLEWDRVVEVNQTEFEYYAEGSEAGSVNAETATRRVASPIAVLKLCLVGEICGSPIRSNGRRKLGSRSPRTRCGIARLQLFLFVASCLSN